MRSQSESVGAVISTLPACRDGNASLCDINSRRAIPGVAKNGCAAVAVRGVTDQVVRMFEVFADLLPPPGVRRYDVTSE